MQLSKPTNPSLKDRLQFANTANINECKLKQNEGNNYWNQNININLFQLKLYAVTSTNPSATDRLQFIYLQTRENIIECKHK